MVLGKGMLKLVFVVGVVKEVVVEVDVIIVALFFYLSVIF